MALKPQKDRMEQELDAAKDRLHRVAQNFSIEWKSFLACAMKLKEQQQTADKSGFETLLLQSQSGLNMLHDMNHARAHKWQDLSSQYGTPLAPSTVEKGEVSQKPHPLSSLRDPNQLLVARALLLARQKENVCRLALTRKPALALDTDKSGRVGSSQTRRRRQDALVTALVRAMDTQHRLRPPSAAEAAPVGPFGRRTSVNAGSSMHQDHRLHVEDLESLLRFAHVQQTHSVALDRFFIRLKWMLTSHRYHLRQRMLELVHTQQTKTSGTTSLQCPLFVISTSRLDAELKLLLQKFAISELSAHGDASLLRGRVDRVVTQSLQATAILDRPKKKSEQEADEEEDAAASASRKEFTDVASESLVERHHWMRSRWDLSQFEIFDTQQSEEVAHYRSQRQKQPLSDDDGMARQNHHADRLLCNELDVVRMSNFEYVKARMEARALGHFDYAFIDLHKDLSTKQDLHMYPTTDEGKPPPPTLLEQATKEAAATQADGTNAMRAGMHETAKQLWQPDILYSYYMLRLISCRAKRHRLLRLLNYFHYIQLTRGNQLSSDQKSTKRSDARHMSEPLSGIKQHPWSVERRQNEYVVVHNRSAQFKRDEKPSLDDEVIFPMARHDLEAIERQMLCSATVFITNQEAKSLPKPALDSSNTSNPTRVMAIDRMQVVCDLYDSELNFQQAKLHLVQRLIANGLEENSEDEFTEGEQMPRRSSPNEIIASLLRRRPLLDFSLEYFYDSYAKETLHLDLQANLQQQIQQYLSQVQQVHHLSYNSGDTDFWITHQILLQDGAMRFQDLQRQLLEEANLKWFSPREVCEFHSLHQAIYEKMLVMWKVVLNVELIAPGVAGVQSLERSASDMLHGNGWQFTVTPQMLMDVCQNLSGPSSQLDATSKKDSRSLVDNLIEGLEVVEWRHRLGQLVYESSVLDRIACFQFEFVSRIEVADLPQHFFFDATQCDANRLLQPLGIELITVNDSRFQALFSQEPHKHSKTVAEWLDAQIVSDMKKTNDHVAGPDHAAAAYRAMLLNLQQSWMEFLSKSVQYQDFVGAHVFEFAASSPFLFHRVALRRNQESFAPSAKNSVPDSQSTNFKAARSKYMGEIAEKMKEDMQKRCFPYWIRVEQLKEMLRKRFLAPAYRHRSTVMQDESQEDDNRREAAALVEAQQRVAACNHYLNTEGTIPHLLVNVDRALEIVRNEQRFMASVTAVSVKPTRNAFTTKIAEQGNHDVANALNQWLTSRLRQLQEDLNGVQDAADSANRNQLAHRVIDPTLVSNGEESNDLLLALPTSRYLLEQFGVALGRDQPSPIAAKTLRESNKLREDTLVVVFQILDQFLQVLTLLRLQCGFRTLMTITNPHHASRRIHARRWDSADDQANALMQRWQAQFHEEIIRFQENLAEYLDPSLATLKLFTPILHQDIVSAHELLRCLQKRKEEIQSCMRCVASFLQIQTIASSRAGSDQSIGDGSASCSAESLLHRDLQNIQTFLLVQTSQNEVAPTFPAHRLYSLAGAGQVALFSDAVTPELTHYGLESSAFWNSLTRQPLELVYLEKLHEWLQLQRIFVLEFAQHKRKSIRLPQEYTEDHSSSSVCTEIIEAGLRALERAWQRYHLFREQESDQKTQFQPTNGPSGAAEPSNSTVSGDSLRMKQHFFGISSDGSSSTIRRGSIMGRNMAMITSNDQQNELNDSDENDCSFLPSATELMSQIAYLRRHFEIQWVQADIDKIQRHFEEFLHKKQQFQSPRTADQTATKQSRSHLMLGALGQFYRPPSETAFLVADQDNDEMSSTEQQESEFCGEFVIPASVMHRVLDDLASDCETHANQLATLYEQATLASRSEQESLQQDLAKLKAERGQYEREETILRESFAMDKIYHLNFQMQTLKQEMQTMKNRTTLEQQGLRCELNAQYEQRLRTLNLQLVTKQQQFEEYRATMQHDLHVQLQGAHNQVVQQLVDQSGTLTVETKSMFLASLKDQEAQEHLAKENVALKQTLLRLQALVEMQQQTQHAAREREQLTQQRYAMKSTLLETENAQLQQQILQLETDLSKVNHEKTMVQLKWNHLQKQTEQSAQKRREAKIRSLSAPYHRASMVQEMESPVSCESPLRQAKESELGRLVSPRKQGRVSRIPDFEAQQEEFEQQHERAIRKPRSSTANTIHSTPHDGIDSSTRVHEQFQSSLRHYQCEIRRLQQQVVKESRVKSALMDQVMQLREILGEDSNAVPELDESLSNEQDDGEKPQHEVAIRTQSARTHSNQRSEGNGFAPHNELQLSLNHPPGRATSASPICTPRRPPSSSVSHNAGIKRPNTSFTPRASTLQRPTSSSAVSTSSRAVGHGVPPPSTPAKTRKFQVHKREEPRLGAVEGVPNVLSVREPLPYR